MQQARCMDGLKARLAVPFCLLAFIAVFFKYLDGEKVPDQIGKFASTSTGTAVCVFVLLFILCMLLLLLCVCSEQGSPQRASPSPRGDVEEGDERLPRRRSRNTSLRGGMPTHDDDYNGQETGAPAMSRDFAERQRLHGLKMLFSFVSSPGTPLGVAIWVLLVTKIGMWPANGTVALAHQAVFFPCCWWLTGVVAMAIYLVKSCGITSLSTDDDVMDAIRNFGPTARDEIKQIAHWVRHATRDVMWAKCYTALSFGLNYLLGKTPTGCDGPFTRPDVDAFAHVLLFLVVNLPGHLVEASFWNLWERLRPQVCGVVVFFGLVYAAIAETQAAVPGVSVKSIVTLAGLCSMKTIIRASVAYVPGGDYGAAMASFKTTLCSFAGGIYSPREGEDSRRATFEAGWKSRFEALKAWMSQNGGRFPRCPGSGAGPEECTLGKWLSTQRQRLAGTIDSRKRKITEDERLALAKLNVYGLDKKQPQSRETIAAFFAQYVAFFAAYGLFPDTNAMKQQDRAEHPLPGARPLQPGEWQCPCGKIFQPYPTVVGNITQHKQRCFGQWVSIEVVRSSSNLGQLYDKVMRYHRGGDTSKIHVSRFGFTVKQVEELKAIGKWNKNFVCADGREPFDEDADAIDLTTEAPAPAPAGQIDLTTLSD